MLFTPSISQPAASAVEDNSGISTYAVTPTVGISLPTSIDFADVLPTPSGATTTATADLTVTTTNSASYSLYLYSSEGDNSLKSSNPANISKINATAGDVGLTLSSLEPNTWGYNLGTEAPTDSTTYSAVPTDNSTPIQTKDTSDTNSANDTYTLSFGAKVDSTIASGAYSNALTVAVVAEPGDIVINYDANGGYFNGDASQTTNSVSYDIKELSTETISNGGSTYYDETTTIPGATSLIVEFTCYATRMGHVSLYDGAGNSIAYCSGGPSIDENIPSSISDTYVISGDSLRVSLFDDRTGTYFNAEVTGYEITPTSSTQELTPTRPNYEFSGWYTDAAGTSGNEFIPNGNMTSGTTVYAKWKAITYIQDFTNSQCQSLASDADFTVVDKRDGSDYTVRYINGACCMTQNLRLSGGRTLTSADSNVTRNWSFPTGSLTSGATYTEARSTISSNTSYGGYYNYCTASAGTVCNNSTEQDATQDICPKGWRIPTRAEQNGITSYSSAFSPVYSGRYYDGTLYYTGSYGGWRSATADYISTPYNLYYGGSSLNTEYSSKDLGLSVRGIRNNSGTSGGGDSSDNH